MREEEEEEWLGEQFFGVGRGGGSDGVWQLGLAMVGATMHSFECRPRVGWARGEGNVVGTF